MDMYTPDAIIRCAIAIRLVAPRLLDDADLTPFQGELEKLMARAGAGEAVENEIILVLRRTKRTREWVSNYLDSFRTQPMPITRGGAGSPASFQPVAGDMAPVQASAEYWCPAHGTRWVQQFAGTKPPACKVCGQPLKPFPSC